MTTGRLLLERDEQLATLMEAMAAAAGQGRMVLLGGEAGSSRAPAPMLPPRLFRSPAFVAATGVESCYHF
jgi:hypothetical protein